MIVGRITPRSRYNRALRAEHDRWPISSEAVPLQLKLWERCGARVERGGSVH